MKTYSLNAPVHLCKDVTLNKKIARVFIIIASACMLWTGSARAAAHIDTVYRSTTSDGQGVDFTPFAEDDQADPHSSSLAGSYTAHSAVPISLNDNVALFEADIVSNVDVAGLSFLGNGTVHIDQDARFDANDVANGAFFQGSSGSSFSVFFTLTNSGKINLSTTLTAARSFSSGASASFVSISGRIEIKKGATVIWSRYTSGGTITFNGDVALAAGQYQLFIFSGSNVSLSASGAQFAQTNGSFAITGKISETSGGKKGH